jgi:Cdc6-like AAA superfamily ATPase
MASRAEAPGRTLTGREAELAAVREVLDRAADGQSETLLVFGEVGVGKTASSSTRRPEPDSRRCC